MSEAPAWLVARPIAHRGLHGGAVVENSLGAARAAIRHGFAIECDVRLTADNDAVVFHDGDLARLTGLPDLVVAHTSAALQAVRYRVGGEGICTLQTLLREIDGRVPLICEIKSEFDGDLRLTERVRDLVAAYRGPIALKSFDPAPIAALRAQAPCPLGIVAEAAYDDPEWDGLSPVTKRDLAEMLHFGRTQPDFLSYAAADLPRAAPFLCRTALGLPVMAWTVRSPDAWERAAPWSDQMVFERFLPMEPERPAV